MTPVTSSHPDAPLDPHAPLSSGDLTGDRPLAEQYPELDLAPMLVHGLLHPAATPERVEQWCAEADRYGFPAVLVFPSAVPQAVALLHNKRPRVATVIGFPSGATTAAVKRYEAMEALDHGATELDVTLNLGLLKSGETDAAHREIAEICEAADRRVTVTLEMSLLTAAELRTAVDLCLDAGVMALKTHTGWHGSATVAEVQQLRELSRGQVLIEAAGGIRDLERAIALVLAGANRLGTSWGVTLMQQRQAS
jgi:deoxyribose-phosphate aldolase